MRRREPVPPAREFSGCLDEPGQEDQPDDRHQLDEDVERGTRGVLEGVTDRVADHRGLVDPKTPKPRKELIIKLMKSLQNLFLIVGSTFT